MSSNLTPEQLEKRKSKNKKILKYVGIPAVLVWLFVLFGTDDKSEPSQAETKQSVSIGQSLKTNYFDVTVNSAILSDEVNTGNRFSSKTAGAGERFIIMDVSFKNTDSESRMVTNGVILINYNGKDYTFDKSEAVLAKGFGTLEQINPLSTITTKIVYKIPKEVTGIAYYRPGRAGDDELISLGELKSE